MAEKRVRRSASELIEEQRAKLAALERRAALESASKRPELKPIVEAIASFDLAALEAKRGLTNGPQSFETRSMSHKLWIKEIEASAALASARLANIETDKAALVTLLAEMTAKLTNGETLNVGDVQTAVDASVSDMPSEVSDLFAIAESAKEARIAFNEVKRAPKRTTENAASTDSGN